MNIRIGIGYDIHRLGKGRILYLGGVSIPFPKGLIGHSDGDCLVHAIIDALLGALGEKDIGQNFPDDNPEYKNIRSTILLAEVTDMLNVMKAQIVNLDTVVIVEKPKLKDYIPKMKATLAPIMGLDETMLGIKAKTNEGLGEIGQGEAIAAWATVLIRFK